MSLTIRSMFQIDEQTGRESWAVHLTEFGAQGIVSDTFVSKHSTMEQAADAMNAFRESFAGVAA